MTIPAPPKPAFVLSRTHNKLLDEIATAKRLAGAMLAERRPVTADFWARIAEQQMIALKHAVEADARAARQRRDSTGATR